MNDFNSVCHIAQIYFYQLSIRHCLKHFPFTGEISTQKKFHKKVEFYAIPTNATPAHSSFEIMEKYAM